MQIGVGQLQVALAGHVGRQRAEIIAADRHFADERQRVKDASDTILAAKAGNELLLAAATKRGEESKLMVDLAQAETSEVRATLITVQAECAEVHAALVAAQAALELAQTKLVAAGEERDLAQQATTAMHEVMEGRQAQSIADLQALQVLHADELEVQGAASSDAMTALQVQHAQTLAELATRHQEEVAAIKEKLVRSAASLAEREAELAAAVADGQGKASELAQLSADNAELEANAWLAHGYTTDSETEACHSSVTKRPGPTADAPSFKRRKPTPSSPPSIKPPTSRGPPGASPV